MRYPSLLMPLVVAFAPFVYLIGYYLGAEAIRAQAVKAGVAEYKIDNKTGETKFVYLSQKIENKEK